jgi:aldehyde:ferredoxin oxidoreductase
MQSKLLRINLTENTIKQEEIPPVLIEKFIGGRGLGVKYLYDELKANTEPLSEDNKLLFVTGLAHGSMAATSSRYTVVTKSPLTGTINSANSGGHFGADLKATGFNMLIIEGASKKPVYLKIDEEDVAILDAEDIWGKKVNETTDFLKNLHGTKNGIACIGPAGENLSLISAIMNEKEHAAARGGVGAVMGSKKLKAIVISGTQKAEFLNPENVEAQKKEWQRYLGEAPLTKDILKEYGTPVLVKAINNRGALGTRNFQESVFDDATSLSAETLKQLYYQKTTPCKYCTIGCAHETAVDNRSGKGPEFETIWAFGAMCGINDLRAVLHANYNCNEQGLDTISAGNTIACAMELSEKGLLSEKWEQLFQKKLNRKLMFGDGEAVMTLTELMGSDDELGKALSLGSYRFADLSNSSKYAMQAKKLELPAYDARGFRGMSLALATSNRGGCHQKAFLISNECINFPFEVERFTDAGKPGLVKLYQELTAVIDSLGVCLFTNFALNPKHYADMLGAIFNKDYSPEEMLESGERIWNLEKLFNLREGFTRQDDDLPERLKEEPLTKGHSKGKAVNLQSMLNEYYNIRGWDENGIPTKEKLSYLGL